MAQRLRCAPLDAPMGFDIDAFRCCRAFPRRPDELDVSPCERARVASPDPNVVGKAKCFGFVWLLASHARRLPEGGRPPVPARRQSEDCRGFRSRPIASPKGAKGIGRVGLRRIPKEAPRPHPVRPRRVPRMPMARPRREDPPRQLRGTRRRSVSDESHRIPEGTVRDSAHAPKGCAGGSSSC